MSEIDPKEIALKCCELADNRKAENLQVLDMRPVSSIADYFVLVSGTGDPHLRAIVEEIQDGLRKDYGMRPFAVEGKMDAGWIVLDYFDVVIHAMRADMREHYDLEGLWGDAPRVPVPVPADARGNAPS